MLQIKGFRAALLGIFLLSLLGVQLNAKAEKQTVYVIPVEKNVEQGLASFLSRSLQDAKDAHADHIVLDINTPGGLVKSAIDMADLITESEIPVTAYVNKRALSAGAYIALQADHIYMAPGGKMGAAAIVDGQGNAADQKAQSLWLAEMEDAAVKNNRDPKYALAMADPDIDAKEVGAPKGDLLTLNADKAIEVGYSEGTADNLSTLVKKLGFEKAQISYAKESFAEKTARWLTNPVIVPILLTIAFLGLTVELFSPGVGLLERLDSLRYCCSFTGILQPALPGMRRFSSL